ncbi:MAG: hypothetical protein AUH92_05565 [Acidobacteria bacterium 13_1_40CM_4_69_4]|nr:MAG: hypothetical protein AUH92_05565 [Acidobacteria bacterium 13_1_40CM_4_69_4]
MMNALALLAAVAAVSPAIEERTLRLPIVGEATVYVPPAPTDRAILFLSGDGGWSKGVLDMARRAAVGASAVVAGVPCPRLREAARASRGPCWYPAGDLEVIGQALEKQLRFSEYTRPFLIGYSSGATLVYTALAASSESFSGGMSLGFCPDLEGVPPLCPHPAFDARKKRADLPPVPEVSCRWEILQGLSDHTCTPEATQAFADEVRGAHVTTMAGVGHGYGNPKKWGEAFDQGLVEIVRVAREAEAAAKPRATAGDPDLEMDLRALGLPLVLRLVEQPRAVLLFISGDGGWSNFDKTLVQILAEHDISTIAINTLKYFWHEKPPDQVAGDLKKLVEICRRAGLPLLAGGYSFGAEVMPVVLDRQDLKGVFAGLILISPGPNASFEVSMLDWLRTKEKSTPYKVVDHARALEGLPTFCAAGEKDEESICAALRGEEHRDVLLLPGAHHFSGQYEKVGDAAAAFVDRILSRDKDTVPEP